MATEIVTSVHITAAPRQVWEVLASFAEWPEWHPTIVAFDGAATSGERLRFRARSAEGGRAVTLRPTVTAADPDHLLRWRGHFLVRGLFDATHEFTLEATQGGTLITQREHFTGLLLPLMGGVVRRTKHNNRRADSALKERVERAVVA